MAGGRGAWLRELRHPGMAGGVSAGCGGTHVAKIERGEDAGSRNSGAISATEDEGTRRFAEA
jgi:hypothetical protein